MVMREINRDPITIPGTHLAGVADAFGALLYFFPLPVFPPLFRFHEERPQHPQHGPKSLNSSQSESEQSKKRRITYVRTPQIPRAWRIPPTVKMPKATEGNAFTANTRTAQLATLIHTDLMKEPHVIGHRRGRVRGRIPGRDRLHRGRRDGQGQACRRQGHDLKRIVQRHHERVPGRLLRETGLPEYYGII